MARWFHTVFWDQHRLMIPIDYRSVQMRKSMINQEISWGTLFSMYLRTKRVCSSVLKGYSGGCLTVSNEHINEHSNHHNDAWVWVGVSTSFMTSKQSIYHASIHLMSRCGGLVYRFSIFESDRLLFCELLGVTRQSNSWEKRQSRKIWRVLFWGILASWLRVWGARTL